MFSDVIGDNREEAITHCEWSRGMKNDGSQGEILLVVFQWIIVLFHFWFSGRFSRVCYVGILDDSFSQFEC
jgi:hypothetical protein